MEFTDLIKTAKIDNVVLWNPHVHKKVTGTLCLTSHHILFSDRTSHQNELMLLYMFIEQLDRKFSGAAGILTITCKDFTTFKLKIPGQEEAFNVAASIDALSTFESASLYYPFFYRHTSFTIEENGWHLFSFQHEYQKMIGNSKRWRLSLVNMKHEVCSSYPKYCVLPAAAEDDMIRRVCKFRQDGRFPVLSYLHSNETPLLRSSQPLNGQNNKRNKDDERLLSFVLNGHSSKGRIIDTRSTTTATQHKGKGGGFETSQYYPQWIRQCSGLVRPQNLGDSMSELYSSCVDCKTTSWLSKLDGSCWLTHIESILKVTNTVVEFIHIRAAPVLVHGERGSDLTLLITSLSQIFLAPESRTIIGFESLIVREWLWGGYPFTERHLKIGISTVKRKEHSPVFLLFLDCVHQIINQYPNSFEFTEELLLLLAQHAYASEYGTFLFNNEWQREQSKTSEKTFSLWSYINREEILQTIRNPIYEKNMSVLHPSIAPQSLSTLSVGPDSRKEIGSIVVEARNANVDLKEKTKLLQREYEQLRDTYTSQIEN